MAAPLQIQVRTKGESDVVLFQSTLAPHVTLVHLKKAILAISKPKGSKSEGSLLQSTEDVDVLRDRILALEEEIERLKELIQHKDMIINTAFSDRADGSVPDAAASPSQEKEKEEEGSPRDEKERNATSVKFGSDTEDGARVSADASPDSTPRSKGKTDKADKRSERRKLNKGLLLKKESSLRSAILDESSGQVSPKKAVHVQETEPDEKTKVGDGDDTRDGKEAETDDAEQKKRKQEVFLQFQRQVSITNMALFAQQEKQKLVTQKMLERERDRQRLSQSIEKLQLSSSSSSSEVPSLAQPRDEKSPQSASSAPPEDKHEESKSEQELSTEGEGKEDEIVTAPSAESSADAAATSPSLAVSEPAVNHDQAQGHHDEHEDEAIAVEEKHRARVRNELIETEISYIHNIQILDAVLHAIREARVIDSNMLNIRELSTLLTLHQTFLSELQQEGSSFLESFLSFIPFMKACPLLVLKFVIYTAYFNAYSQVSSNMTKLYSNPAFVSILKECEERLKKESGSAGIILDLDSLLILPIQRIPRYELLLSDYLKHSQQHAEELPRINKLLASIKELNVFLNQARRNEECVKQLSEIQKSLVFSKGRENPIRRLIHRGKLRIKSRDEQQQQQQYESEGSAGSGDDQPSTTAEPLRRRTSVLMRQRSFDANRHRQRDRIASSAMANIQPPAEGGSEDPTQSSSGDESAATSSVAMSTTITSAAAGDVHAAGSGSRVQRDRAMKSSDHKEERSTGQSKSGSQRFLPSSRAMRGGRSGSKIGKPRYKKRHFFLFDDILVETEPEKDARYRFIRSYPLLDHFIASAREGEDKEVIALVAPTGERYLLKAKNQQEKVVWMEALLKCMEQS